MSSFDPYHKWLGIPLEEQPADHYRLLGITRFEADPDVIEAAADRQMKYVSQCAVGEHMNHSQRILNELSAARVCLLVAAKKKAYDADLKTKLTESQRIEQSMVPLVLDDPLADLARLAMDDANRPQGRRSSKSKSRSSTVKKSGRKSGRSSKSFGISIAIIAMIVLLAVGITSFLDRRHGRPAIVSESRSSPQAATIPVNIDMPSPSRPAFEIASSVNSDAAETASQQTAPAKPVPVKPAVMNTDDKVADKQAIEEFGPSYVETKGDEKGAVIAGSEPFSPSDQFTIEFWVSTLAERGTLISKRQMDGLPSIIVHLDNGVPNLSIAIGGMERGSGGGMPINDEKWHHIAMVKSGEQLTLFVDGRRTVMNSESTPMISPSPWKFGCSTYRTPCEARFGGVRISKVARYHDTFQPVKRHEIDDDTLLPR